MTKLQFRRDRTVVKSPLWPDMALRKRSHATSHTVSESRSVQERCEIASSWGTNGSLQFDAFPRVIHEKPRGGDIRVTILEGFVYLLGFKEASTADFVIGV